MHSKIQTTFIGTQESVYRDSPAGKLEEFGLVRTMNIPLQQGFDNILERRIYKRMSQFLPSLKGMGFLATLR